jgi:hypothetical protein
LAALDTLAGGMQAVSNVSGAQGGAQSLSGLPTNLAAQLSGGLVGTGVQAASYAADAAPGSIYTYVMTGEFKFEASTSSRLLFGMTGSSSLNHGFDTFDLSISNNGVSLYSHTFTTLSEANAFFNAQVMDFGLFGQAGMQDVVITSSLTAGSMAGYGFSYAVAAVPEPVEWLMMLMGLSVILVVQRRRSRA